MEKVIVSGEEFDLDAVVNLMCREISEELHSQDFKNEQEFVDAYRKAHEEKYNEEFIVN